MKLAQTVVKSIGFRDTAHNPTRLRVLSGLLPKLADEGVDVVALPAGFLTVSSEDDVSAAAAGVADMVERSGVGVIAGIDATATLDDEATDADQLVRAGRLPAFGFAALPTARHPEVPIWRQTSVSSSQAELVDDAALPDGDRLVPGGGTSVGVLICGELFSWRARESIAAASPALVVDLGHAGMGQGLIPAMRNVAELAGCPVGHSQHLAWWDGRSLHYIAADGAQESVSTDGSPSVEEGDFWIGWRVRSV